METYINKIYIKQAVSLARLTACRYRNFTRKPLAFGKNRIYLFYSVSIIHSTIVNSDEVTSVFTHCAFIFIFQECLKALLKKINDRKREFTSYFTLTIFSQGKAIKILNKYSHNSIKCFHFSSKVSVSSCKDRNIMT